MTRIASHRLIEAAATLEPADRSLLSLLISHGLDDDALSRLTSASSDTIASRRTALIGRLSSALGLPPEVVAEAIEELATSARVRPAPVGRSFTNGNHAPASIPLDTASPAVSTAPRGAPSRQPAASARLRRRRAIALLAVALALAVAVVVALGQGQGRRAGPRNVTITAVGRSLQDQLPFAALPGGPPGATGSIAVLGTAARARLVLTVSRLPSTGRGHYELWLYNSIIDSLALARLVTPSRGLVIALPADHARYRWLDISLQPPGHVDHSGESILRVALPG